MDLEEEYFLSNPQWFSTLEFLSAEDICSFCRVCSSFNNLVNLCSTESEALWKRLLIREYHLTPAFFDRFSLDKSSIRELYIAYKRSKISSVGKISPKLSDKHVRKSKHLQRWARTHGLKPFWVLQLFHTNTSRFCSRYTVDHDSYFGNVLEIQECWNIQVEGSVRVWKPGFYRVVWRLKLAVDYEGIAPLNFLTKVTTSFKLREAMDEEEQNQADKHELAWEEDEIMNPLCIDGSYTSFVWSPPNPLPQNAVPEQAQADLVHPNDRPFGQADPEPQEQRRPAFGFEIQQQLFDLNQGLGGLPNQNVNRNDLADPAAAAAAAAGDDQMPALEPALHGRANTAESPFPVGTWFDLLAGFIEVPKHRDAVCFAITNLSMGYKYGLFVDYVALYPVSELEYKNRHNFTLGPLLLDSCRYWDALCEQSIIHETEDLK